MYDTPVVCFLVMLFAGIIMVMLSRLSQTSTVTVYKYLPRDLDTWLRESPNATISQNRLFATDDWSRVKAAHTGGTASQTPTLAPALAPAPTTTALRLSGSTQRVGTSGGLFAGMSHTRVPGT